MDKLLSDIFEIKVVYGLYYLNFETGNLYKREQFDEQIQVINHEQDIKIELIQDETLNAYSNELKQWNNDVNKEFQKVITKIK